MSQEKARVPFEEKLREERDAAEVRQEQALAVTLKTEIEAKEWEERCEAAESALMDLEASLAESESRTADD